MPVHKVSDPEMVNTSALVAEGFTNETYAYLLSLLPTPQSYAEQHERFEASYAASLKGEPVKVKECEKHRSVINESLTILLRVAKAAAVKDPGVLEILGLHRMVENAALPAKVVLGQPAGFRVVFDPTAQIFASVVKVPGAKGYQVWGCDDDPVLEGNWRLIASSPKCRRIVITGLNRNKTNWLKMRALRGNGHGPWSNCISLPPA